MIVLEGRLESITFRNESTRYTVARFKTGSAARPVKVVGFIDHPVAGQILRLTGKWITHPRYGQQFDIAAAELTVPETVDGMREYLKSGIIRGIGPATVNRIIGHFGEETLHVLDHAPERLREVAGIGQARARSISGQWLEHRSVSEIMNLLQRFGIKGAYGPKIYAIYGSRSMDILTENPYRLAEDMAGKGFFIADTIARQTGGVPSGPGRARACIDHILREEASAGHVFVLMNRLIDKMHRLFEIDPDTTAGAVSMAASEERIIVEDIPAPEAGPEDMPEDVKAVFSHSLHHAETRIAQRIAAMQGLPMEPLPLEKTGLLDMVENRFLLRLSGEQRRSIDTVLSSRVSVITGGPGTGKTTLIKSIAAGFSHMGLRVCLAAPTGRAARRISEVTLRPAHTLHKLLGYHFETQTFEKSTDDPIDADVMIVDEASMIDTQLMYHLVCATRLPTRLILVGDMFQLPPVGPGNVLGDIIASDTVPVCFLNEIFRQAGESPIASSAHMIRDGICPEIPDFKHNGGAPAEFSFIEAETPEKIASEIVRLCTETLPKAFAMRPKEDIQVLSPVHKGEAGTIQLNALLQAALNPGQRSAPGTSLPFRPGDRVMHLRNNYQKDVFNGDTGIVAGIDPTGLEITVDYYGRPVSYTPDDIDELTLGYAITVHKSQGSEYPAVIIPMTTRHYTMLQRNLIYTAVTRAKSVVIMVGARKALSVALRNNRPRLRFTSLSGRLRAACGHTMYG